MNDDYLVIRVKDFPTQLLSVSYLEYLYIDFIGEIDIPVKFADTKIDNLTLYGKITQTEIDRIVKIFPKTNIEINGEVVNSVK